MSGPDGSDGPSSAPARPGGQRVGRPSDLEALVRQASLALEKPTDQDHTSGATTDLSIDEELALHAVGWEPVDLVCGVSLHSVPSGVWTWGQGEITWASEALMRAFGFAAQRIEQDCRRAGGLGVVGVRVERRVRRHHIEVALEGTAVRPVPKGGRGRTSAGTSGRAPDRGVGGATGVKGESGATPERVFVSDLSGRDFALLDAAGWLPLGLAAGASFVYAPRRSVGTVMRQTSQNVELTNLTEALYAARESAMERMQRAAMSLAGHGVVGVKVTEGPVDFASHAIGFAAYGTVVRSLDGRHRRIEPQAVLPLDDVVRGVEATSLRGG